MAAKKKKAAKKASANGHIAKPLQSLAIAIGKVNLDPANARSHNAKNIQAIKDSLTRFGQRLPVVVQKQGMIVRAGNGRVMAARELGWDTIAAVVVDESSVDATAFALADNRTAELAEWDDDALRMVLSSLEDEGVDPVGWDDSELEALLKDPQGEVVEDEVPEPPEEPTSKRGQLWALGRHRVLCGDSTSAEDVASLMDGEKAGVCFTSPPYAQQRDYGEASDVSDWDGLMKGVFENLPMEDDGQVLVNLGLTHRDGEWVPYWDGWIESMRSEGWRRFGWYVWDKVSVMPGDHGGRLAPRHEWVFHFNREAVKPKKTEPCATAGEPIRGSAPRSADGVLRPLHGDGGTRNSHRVRDSVAAIVKSNAAVDHPAVMPIGLPAYFFEPWPGAVYDPFLGSGTTLIAAEQLGRTCYGIEIEPRYVDVIIQRWENLTGETAELLSDGS